MTVPYLITKKEKRTEIARNKNKNDIYTADTNKYGQETRNFHSLA
jgi:hypothetical protein